MNSAPGHADRSHRRQGFLSLFFGLMACAAVPAAAACRPGDAKTAGNYVASLAQSKASLRLNEDGSFRLRGVPEETVDYSGCWELRGPSVMLVYIAPGEGLKRVLPRPLGPADLNELRAYDVRTLEQAVAEGFLPIGRVWAHQPRKAGESVRVKLYEADAGLALGDAKVVLRLADGETVEGARMPNADGEYEFTRLPAAAAVKAIGIRFPPRPDRVRWLTLDDATKRFYLVEVDAAVAGYVQNSTMTLSLQMDRSLMFNDPSRAHFKRTP